MQSHSVWILLALAAITLAGCAGRQQREVVNEQPYWRDSQTQCDCCDSCDAGGTLPQSVSEPGMLQRINPFHQGSGALLFNRKICSGCNLPADALMDGMCVDCLKASIDNSSRGSGPTRRSIVKHGRIEGSTEPDSFGDDSAAPKMTTRRKLPEIPAAPMTRSPEAALGLGSQNAPDPINSESQTVKSNRTNISPDGGSFVPGGNSALPPENADLDGAVAENQSESPDDDYPTVDRLPVSNQELAADSSPEDPSDSGETSPPAPADSGPETDPISEPAVADPGTENYQLSDVMSEIREAVKRAQEAREKIANSLNPDSSSNTGATDKVPTAEESISDDEIDWGPPIRNSTLNNSGSPAQNPAGNSNGKDGVPPRVSPHENESAENTSGRTEREIIEALRNSTVPDQIIFDNTPAIPEQQSTAPPILLTAKPVPGYQELQRLAGHRRSSHSDDIPPRRRIEAIPASTGNRNYDSDFQFRPLPVISDQSSSALEPLEAQELIDEIFEPIDFPTQVPTGIDAHAKSAAPNVQQHPAILPTSSSRPPRLHPAGFRRPSNDVRGSSGVRARSSNRPVLLKAVPEAGQQSTDSRSENPSSRAAFKFD